MLLDVAEVVVVDAALRAIDVLKEVLLVLLGLGEVLLIGCRLAVRGIGCGGRSSCVRYTLGRCAASSGLLARCGDDLLPSLVVVVSRVAHLVRDVVAPRGRASRRWVLRQLLRRCCILMLLTVRDRRRICPMMILVIVPLAGVVVGASHAVIHTDAHMTVDRHRRGVRMRRPNPTTVVQVIGLGLLLLLICRR